MAQTLIAHPSFHVRLPRTAPLRALWQAWLRRSAEKRQLAQFDARELRDVGLTGADRAAILATPFWREADRRR